jgi:gamma-glutamylcyclotransferase (GGCT)/AIG2-like uncharacterized protein YtfP
MSLYFAYGSNMNADQMAERCPESEFVGKACLEGYRLDFTTYSRSRGGGAADVLVDPTAEVWGLVFDLSDNDLQRLDRKEGTDYRRCQREVVTSANVTLIAWVYEVITKSDSFVPPTAAYMKLLIDAAVKHAFPDAYIQMLGNVETA